VVRRPPPVLTSPTRRRPGPGLVALGIPLVALAYFLAAPALPALDAGDTRVLVAGGIGLLVLAATTLSLLPARETVVGPLLIALGAGLIGGALNSAGVGAGANVAEAMLAAAVGLLFARFLSSAAVAILVPLFVGTIDVWSVASGPTSRLLAADAKASDPLSFDLPAWGGGSAGQLGVSDAVFLSMFAAWACHFGFRRGATIAGLALGLIASLVLSIVLDRAIPALPLIAIGYLLPNLDRIGRLLRHEGAAPRD
jgi:hypothetical protein